MRRRRPPLCLSLAAAGVTFVASWAAAAELRLSLRNGRVDLVARDVTLGQVLAEWERVGGTAFDARALASDVPVSIELSGASESQALDILLRTAPGYVATTRSDPAGGASSFSRVLVMAGSRPAPVPAATLAPAAGPSRGDPARGDAPGSEAGAPEEPVQPQARRPQPYYLTPPPESPAIQDPHAPPAVPLADGVSGPVATPGARATAPASPAPARTAARPGTVIAEPALPPSPYPPKTATPSTPQKPPGF